MPEFSFNGEDFERADNAYRYSDLPFEVTDTTLYLNGRSTSFLLLGMADGQNDSLVLSIVRSYAVMAESITRGFFSLGEKGAIINLASDKETIRTEFSIMVKDGKQLGFPIVLLWDKNSAKRAINLIGEVNKIKEFTLIQINPGSMDYDYQKENCFQFSSSQ